MIRDDLGDSFSPPQYPSIVLLSVCCIGSEVSPLEFYDLFFVFCEWRSFALLRGRPVSGPPFVF